MSVIDNLIDAQLSRNGSTNAKGTIIPLHCAQMREYGSRGGRIQFDCPQDDEINSRGNAIADWYDSNDLGSKMDYIFDVFVCRGEILWLTLPLEDNKYWIEFFQGGTSHKHPQFKLYYKRGGREIEAATIRYSYEKDDSEIGSVNGYGLPSPGFAHVDGEQKTLGWVKLIITADTIVAIDCNSEPDLRREYRGYENNNVVVSANPFAPILPVSLAVNNPQQTGKQGTGDFHVFAHLIEQHEARLGWVDTNLSTFGNPTLVTTRSPQEVAEVTTDITTNTWAANQGFKDNVGDGLGVPSDKSLTGRSASNKRVKKIVGNVQPDERFGYIQVDPISADLTNYIRNDRELIHWCLGGVDPIGISTSATFGEIKTLFGRVQNTADKKANSLFKALGKLFSIMVANEEQKFKANLIVAIANSKLASQIPNLESLSDESAQQIYQLWRTGQLDKYQIRFDTKIGLPPMGDRRVVWRHTREVYKPSTRDLLDLSIVGRNLREDGLNQEFTMGRLYPELSPKEIQAATSGFSPRVIENQMKGIISLLQFYQQAMAISGTQDPNIPLGLELGINELIASAIESLRKELNYGKPNYTAADASTTPANLSANISELLARINSSSSSPGASLSAAESTTSIAANIPIAGTN
jgi:hypothetical protein